MRLWPDPFELERKRLTDPGSFAQRTSHKNSRWGEVTDVIWITLKRAWRYFSIYDSCSSRNNSDCHECVSGGLFYACDVLDEVSVTSPLPIFPYIHLQIDYLLNFYGHTYTIFIDRWRSITRTRFLRDKLKLLERIFLLHLWWSEFLDIQNIFLSKLFVRSYWIGWKM